MKKTARCFALLLTLVLLISTVSAVAPVTRTGEITRSEWISQLVETFEMKIENPDNMPDNYYSDLSADADYYMDIMVAVEFGVIDLDAGYPFYPDDPVTREFAAHTLNFCLGFQPPEETIGCGDSAELSYPDDVQVALRRGWFALSGGNFLPNQPVTAEEAEAMLADAAAVLAPTATVENHFTLAEGVIDATAAETEVESDSSVILHAFDGVITVNDLFVVSLDGYPVAFQALGVEETEDGALRIQVSTEGTDGAISALSYAGTASADLGTFTPVETTTYEIVDTSDGEYAQIETLSVEPQGIHYDKNTKTLTANLQLKVDGNSAGSVSVTLRNCNLEHWEEWNSPFTIDYASAILCADVDVNSSITFDFGSYAGLPHSLTIGRVDIIPFVCGVELNVEYDISGGLSLSWTGDMSAGFEYDSGDFRIIKWFEKKEFSFTAEAELRTGLAIVASIDLVAVEGTIRAGAGAAMDFRATTYDSGTPSTCVSMNGYLYFDGSVNVRVLIKHWTKSFVIFNKRNSPVRVSYHYEDNVLVTRCTRGDTGGGHSHYYTSPGSHYFNPSPSYGQSYTGSGGEPIQIYEYEVEDQYYAVITGYNGNATAIAIPSEIDGYEVRTIGSNAFSGKAIRSVVIPNSVIEIRGGAFSGCTSLSSVKLSANLETLESNAFYGCSSLKEIYIPKSLEKVTGDGGGAGPFSNSGLTTVTFEPGTTRVARYLFSNASNLQSVTLQDTITEIGEYAFQRCTSMQNIDIPSSVTLIDRSAFYGCTNLQAIDIPSSVTVIGYNAFTNCASMESIIIPNSVIEVKAGAFSGCTSLSSVKLSANLETLESNAFYGCSSLKEIYIPKSLEKATGDGGGAGPFSNSGLTTVTFEPGTTCVARYLFSNASNLQSVTLQDTITEIGEYAFQRCTSMQNIDIPSSVTLIDRSAFYGCTNLQAIDIPSSVTVIGYNAFTNCVNMQSIIIPNSVIEIKGGAFSSCTSLSSVKLSANLETLESNAFYGCSSLKEIYIPKSLEKATGDGGGAGPFSNSGLTTATFEPGTTRVARYLFSNASNLQSVTLQDTITEIGECAFQRCTSMQNIDIPSSVTLIDRSAFYGCTNLQAIDIPSSVTVIGYNAFTNCASLASVQLSEGLTTINSSAFSDCTSLASIVIPDSITVIDDSTFRGCSSLASVTLPKSLERINENAFNGSGLTSLTLPNGCRNLESNAFSNCEALEHVTLSAALTSIPSNCFSNCAVLDNVVIPNYVTSIGSGAFANCVALKSITIPRSVTSINTNAFSYKDRLTITGVPGTYAQTFAEDNGFSFAGREVAATSAAIVPTTVTMSSGKTYRLQLEVTPADFTDSITWMSSDSGIVTVDSTGLLTAKSAGEADIRAVIGNAVATCHITVVQPVTRISISPYSVTLNALETQQLTANVSPSNAANKAVTWSSSDPAIASVDENGLVTAHKKGTVTITATATDGSNVSGSCTVTVNNNAYIVYSASQLASPHPYPANCSDIWVLRAEGASYIEITFDPRTAFDSFGSVSDGLYIFGKDETPGEDNRYTGTELAEKTIKVSGDIIVLLLDTDGAVNLWGFAVTELKTDGTVDPYAALKGELEGVEELSTDAEKREAVQRIVKDLEPGVLEEALAQEESGVLEQLETLEAGLEVQTEILVEELAWLTQDEMMVTGAVWNAVSNDLPVTVAVGLPEDTATWDENRFSQVNEFSVHFENAAEALTIPARVTFPVPEGISASAIAVFRQQPDGHMERIACTVTDQLGSGTASVSFFAWGAGDYAITQVKNDLSGAELDESTAKINVFTSESGAVLVCAAYQNNGQMSYISLKKLQMNISQSVEFMDLPEDFAYLRFFLLAGDNYVPLLECVQVNP